MTPRLSIRKRLLRPARQLLSEVRDQELLGLSKSLTAVLSLASV